MTYSASDLPDTTSGRDLWRYSYTLGAPLPTAYSVNLLFSPASYSDLSLAAAPTSPDVTSLVTQPDSFLGADGQLTIIALNALLGPATATVDLEFIWLAAGKPGSQAFEVLDDQFNLIPGDPLDRQTRPAGTQGLSEPAVPGLLGLALAALLGLRRKTKRTAGTQSR